MSKVEFYSQKSEMVYVGWLQDRLIWTWGLAKWKVTGLCHIQIDGTWWNQYREHLKESIWISIRFKIKESIWISKWNSNPDGIPNDGTSIRNMLNVLVSHIKMIQWKFPQEPVSIRKRSDEFGNAVTLLPPCSSEFKFKMQLRMENP